eukprot:TRINITY_DN12378_c1_g1_i1.p2 TRINITY_DN12378_c1_g1~~TRINITY_DN12378_c1_g1_i1.p2  ORF type:complete len:233 (-),score=100.11 TRINITY_DN12378_c1_g1_i1:60-671(-)
MAGPDFSRLGMTLVGLYMMYNVDFKNPANVDIIRIAYGTMQVVTLFSYLFCYFKIERNQNQEKVHIPGSAGSWGAQPTEEETITVQEHDRRELKKFVNQILMGSLITVFIHYKWEVLPPLLMQAVMGLSNLLSNPLIKTYIMGNEVPRPWKEESMFSGLTDADQEDTNATENVEEITEGEKAGSKKSKKNKKASEPVSDKKKD